MSRIGLLLPWLAVVACHNPPPDGEAPDFLADIERRILADPTNAGLFAERARHFERLDSAVAAMNDWQRAIALDSTNAEYHEALGSLFYRKVRLLEAERELTKAMELDTTATSPRLKLAELKLALREYPQAMHLANGALRIDPHLAQGYFLKGWIHMETGDTALALSSYRTAVERDPAYYQAYVQLGVLHAARRERLAAEYYRSALEVKPKGAEALYGLGLFAQENGDDSLALACYSQLKEVEPMNPLPWYNTGYILLVHQGKASEARSAFTQAIERLPTYAQAWYNRGLTYEQEGRYDSAGADFSRAVALDPDLELAAEAIARIRSRGYRIP